MRVWLCVCLHLESAGSPVSMETGGKNVRLDDRRTIYVYTKIAYRAPKSIPKLLINQFLPMLWIRALNFKVYPRITGPLKFFFTPNHLKLRSKKPIFFGGPKSRGSVLDEDRLTPPISVVFGPFSLFFQSMRKLFGIILKIFKIYFFIILFSLSTLVNQNFTQVVLGRGDNQVTSNIHLNSFLKDLKQ